jgi:hypothetical protein
MHEILGLSSLQGVFRVIGRDVLLGAAASKTNGLPLQTVV